MLRIFVNGIEVDIAEDISISLTYTSPLFGSNGNITGSNSYNFQLPATDKNRKIFSFPNRPIVHSQQSTVDYDCRVTFGGVMFIEGVLKLRQADDVMYECVIGMSTGAFANAIRDKSLKDLELEDVDMGVGYVDEWLTDNIAGTKYPEKNYTLFPLRNTQVCGDNTLETAGYAGIPWGEYINYFNNGAFASTFTLKYDTGYLVSGPPPAIVLYEPSNSFSLFPYIGYIIKKIFEYSGYRLGENKIETDEELKELVLIGNATIDISQHTVNLSYFMPDESLEKFLISLGNLLGFTTFINNNKKQVSLVFLKDIVNGKSKEDWTYGTNPTGIILIDESTFKGFEFIFNFPSDDAYIGAHIKDLENITLLGAVATFGDLPGGASAGDVRYVQDERKYYEWALDDTKIYSWTFYSDDILTKLIVDGDSEKRESYVTPTLEWMGDDQVGSYAMHAGWIINGTRKIQVPVMEQPGKWDEREFRNNTFEPRIAFYKGMQKDGNGNDYPLGCFEPLDIDGNVIAGSTFALRWESTYKIAGLYEKFWKDWVERFLRKKDLRLKRQFTARELADLDFSTKKRIGNYDVLVKEIRLNVRKYYLEMGEMDCCIL